MMDLRGAPLSKGISTPSGFVQCSVHNVRRKAECCEMKPVLNADMEVIDYRCVCKPAFTCKSASERQSSDLAGGAVTADARKSARNGESSGSTPLVIDASSTSMTAHSVHHHHQGQLSAAGAADRKAGMGTLFAVSFHAASRSAPDASTFAKTAVVSPKSFPSDREGEAGDNDEGKDDENGEGTRGDGMTISDSDADDVDALDNLPSFTAGAAPATATAAAASLPTAPRGRSRYYDSVQNAGTGGYAPPAKVCWSCGMSGHEKPACPNALCRTCHQKRGPYGLPHRCTPVITPSPFIVCPTPSEWRAATQKTATAVGEPKGMAAVRCVACNEYGHFDCSTVVLPSSYALIASSPPGPAAVPQTATPTCCFCGVRGHTVFGCLQREHVNPDYFERRNQLVADALRCGRGNAAAGVSFNNSGGNLSGSGYSSQQQYQQRSYGSPTGGAQSSFSSLTGYGNNRDGAGGVQRRERGWRDDHGQRGGGNQYSNNRREGGAYHHNSGCVDRDHQRQCYESPSLSRTGGGYASPSLSIPRSRDPFQGGRHGHHEGRSLDKYGGSRHSHSEGEQGGVGSRGHGQRSHYPQQSKHHYHQGSRSGSGYGGDSGHYSGDSLF
ncbi:hypothetical protein LPMP_110620 [Leishmania panamensis]|uniref:CCHC-type domain-containing protein n=1 Tax=Leishmania panamensis TaxID=5679 RepID=A0A088RK23_LEIPA|nr:hypothetical protein LPMP_110620 [Leishmania panamensis]AIN96258.1 hypothetical protein LPMP_110620 [Leishmania panamensis]